MSLEGKAALQVERLVRNAKGKPNIAEMWKALDRAFLHIDYRESKYRQFSSRRWHTDERLTEYMDELISLFHNARPGSDSEFQDEDVKNHLLAGLPFNIMEVVAPYLDISAAGIARKYDIVASQRDALGLGSNTSLDKPLLSIQQKQTSTDPIDAYSEFEQVFAFRDGNR